MARKAIETIVQKQLRRYKAETMLLWLIIGIGAVLVLSGIGVYFYVGRLNVVQYLSTLSVHNFAESEVKMLGNFSKALGIVFALVGVVSIIFALDRLVLRKVAYRMALFIKSRSHQKEQIDIEKIGG